MPFRAGSARAHCHTPRTLVVAGGSRRYGQIPGDKGGCQSSLSGLELELGRQRKAVMIQRWGPGGGGGGVGGARRN